MADGGTRVGVCILQKGCPHVRPVYPFPSIFLYRFRLDRGSDFVSTFILFILFEFV